MPADVERGRYEALDTAAPREEEQALLPDKPLSQEGTETRLEPSPIRHSYTLVHVFASFVAGVLACSLAHYVRGTLCASSSNATHPDQFLAPPYVGSTEVHPFPPTAPTNAFPSLFPTNVGYPGPTPTGAEPALILTAPAYPVHTGAAQLVVPTSLGGARGNHSTGFDLFKKWGNLSPWYSVGRNAFGLDSGPDAPETCRVTGLHFLHRHGARYPTAWSSYGGPADFAGRLHKVATDWTASGDLDFLNEWTYKLGEELLTPFGRQQLCELLIKVWKRCLKVWYQRNFSSTSKHITPTVSFVTSIFFPLWSTVSAPNDLGVSLRLKYGFLLSNFTETNTLPVFRTESQDRMLASAMNFAIGFFGWPVENQYQQTITIEAPGFNNTLAPYETCPNSKISSKADRANSYLREWTGIYLKNALQRLQSQLKGFELSIEDIYRMQQLCAYETVALGYSKFCTLFTEEEWEGFNYALDLYFWYDHAFGSPVARVQGIGYINELIARLTHTPIAIHNTSTNATLHNPITFPLNQSLYVDATHEVVVLNIITALNLSNFAASGPLPADHIPPNRSFKSSQLAPFATNIQFQLLACTSTPGPQIRIIINDGVVPLTGIKGCPEQRDGMCPVDQFVAAQQQIARETDWEWDCHGSWDVPPGTAWNTTTGDAPRRPQ